MSQEFEYPDFFSYPPYFTVQPVESTRQRQISLWKNLVLRYCQHFKVYRIHLDGDTLAVFENTTINRQLPKQAQEVVLQALVEQGSAEWTSRSNRECLVMWRKVAEWAKILYDWAALYGYDDQQILTLPEIMDGDETRKTELHGLDATILHKAVAYLEKQGRARLFGGTDGQDAAVKFFPSNM